jgi:hypothetical protein
MKELSKNDEDGADRVVRMWNQQCSSEQKIQGRKHTAVNHLTRMEAAVFDVYFASIDLTGFEDSWCSEDVLADKRIHAGHRHGSSAGDWSRRVVVSNESEKLMVRNCQQQHSDTPEPLRRKLAKDKVVELSALATLHYSCMGDVKEAGCLDEVSYSKCVHAFASNDVNHMTSLQCAYAEKKPGFQAKDIPLFKELLQKKLDASKGNAPGVRISVHADAIQLDQKKFMVVAEGIHCDLEARVIYKAKLDDLDNRMYHSRQEFLQNRDAEARKVAEKILSTYVKVATWNAGSAPASQKHSLDDYLSCISSKNLVGSGEVKRVVLLNMISPCVHSVAAMAPQ